MTSALVRSGPIGSGKGDPPRQESTVEMHPYVAEAPHMKDYSILHATTIFGDKMQVLCMGKVFQKAISKNSNTIPIIPFGFGVERYRPLHYFSPQSATSIARSTRS